MIKIYGSPLSSAGRCLWLLEELGAEYECIEVNLRDPEARAKYVAEVFPGGKLPYLVDGEVRLFESMAINGYLAAKYRPELVPSDLVQRALCDQWTFWALSNLQPEAYKVLMHGTYLPEAQRNPKELENGRAGCARFLAQLEEAMEHDYLLGNSFTLADINCGSVAHLAMRAGATLGPKTNAWMERLRARPAVIKIYQL
ncbi:MAG TPA: glutathione S-transferase family protein [Polyangiaceae bacterium]